MGVQTHFLTDWDKSSLTSVLVQKLILLKWSLHLGNNIIEMKV